MPNQAGHTGNPWLHDFQWVWKMLLYPKKLRRDTCFSNGGRATSMNSQYLKLIRWKIILSLRRRYSWSANNQKTKSNYPYYCGPNVLDASPWIQCASNASVSSMVGAHSPSNWVSDYKGHVTKTFSNMSFILEASNGMSNECVPF